MATQTPDGVFSVEGTMDALIALLAGDPYNGAHLHLYQSSFNPTPNNVQADFEAAEANFTGYAAAAVTWSTPGVDSAGNPTALSDRVFFQASDAVTPNVIGGAWLQKDVTGPPAEHTVVQYYPFRPAVNMTAALAFLAVVVAVQAPGSPGYATVDN